ncbi:DUF4412 domain-containing protein [Polaribacter ponticola]|uniref:DUF4412 domain-containing protein n=1 Tax=Polaribacter ponticola TaxID=2978475 RepID=A0ABT5SBA4_9FLAO|nr:DUF4412 domain-containing protein [Polaribacter sp. MSW5]MDD7915401.1 DUF4412 domain-containing protein [Polaribacter sp. MSW5]
MKLIKSLLFCFLLLATTSSVNAQFWKKLKKKVQNKVEQKLENKIDKETDKVIDETLDGKKKVEEPKIEESNHMPKLKGDTGVLKLYNFGIEYVTTDVTVSVYGKFDENNLSNAVKTYNSDKIIAPVDAYPVGYALAFNGAGYLNTKDGQIIIHHADSKKIVFSLKGTWNTREGDKPIEGSYTSLNISEIVDKRFANTSSEEKNKNSVSKNSNKNSDANTSFESNSTAIRIPSTFSFSSSLEVKMTSSDGSAVDMEFLTGNYEDIYAMSIASAEMGDEGKMYNVVTPKSITMFMDVGGMKMKKSVAQDAYFQTGFDDKIPADSRDLKKTGATKSILGYNCYEYKHAYEEISVSVWATNNFPASNKNMSLLGIGKVGVVEGFVLEVNYKNGNEMANMKVVKYNKNKAVTINTNEYKSLGF